MCGTNVDRHVAWLAASVHDIELYAIYVMEFAMEGDAFHLEQSPQDFNRLAHGLERLCAFNAHLFGQRIPPGADAAENAIGRQIIERQEGCGE